jgi:hypothetical protein
MSLDSISSSLNPLQYVTFELVRHERAAGHLLRLVAAARALQPDSPELAFVAERFSLATATPTPRPTLEKIIKATSVPFDVAVWRQRLAQRENCVCRIELPTPEGMSYGTGFLVGPDLLLTNHHVVAAAISDRPGSQGKADARQLVARFDYKVLEGTTIHPGTPARLATDWLVDASPHSAVDLQGLPKSGVPSGDELDYALLRLAEPIGELPILLGSDDAAAAAPRGWIPLPSVEWPFAEKRCLFILQHPLGDAMKLALDLEAKMEVNANRTRVIYQTGTEGGSSGSPCFNEVWDLVALHHAGDPSQSGFFQPAFNEGIPIARIVERLASKGCADGLTVV